MRRYIVWMLGLGLGLTFVARAQEPLHLPVPATIRAQDVPQVPGEIGIALSRYQEIRAANFQGWSRGDEPDQDRSMLILTRFADTNQVHRVGFPGGARTQVSFHPEQVMSPEARPGTSDLVYIADAGGAENSQIFLLNSRGGESVRLTDGRSRNTGPKWSPSGRWLAYGSNARNGRDMDLYVVDPDKPDSRRLVKEVSGSWFVADWSLDESRLAAIEYVSINESFVHLVDVKTGATESLTPRSRRPVAFGQVRWSKDGDRLFWTTDRDAEFLRLAAFDLKAKQEAVLTPDLGWDVEEFDLSDDGQWLAYLANEDGISRLHVIDLKTGDEKPAPNLPAGVMRGLAFRPGSHEIGFTLSSAKSPSDAYSFNMNDQSLARWTNSETAGLPVSDFVEPELIRFETFDDREIPAFVYRPPVDRFPGPRPVLINIHGGPEGQFRPGFLGRANYLINELGIALIFPNVRGSSGFGKTYLQLDNGFKRADSVKDIGALLDWITRRDEFDTSRVGVTGGSYGGFMSLAVQTTYNDRIKAGIDIVGISNFVTFLQNTQNYRRDLRPRRVRRRTRARDAGLP